MNWEIKTICVTRLIVIFTVMWVVWNQTRKTSEACLYSDIVVNKAGAVPALSGLTV